MIEQLESHPKIHHRGKLSFNEFGERIKVQMRREHRELRHPEGDVAPTVFLYFGERLFAMQLDPVWFDSRQTKDALTEQVVKFVQMAPIIGARTVGQLTPVQYVGLVYGMFEAFAVFPTTPEVQEAIARNELPPGFKQPGEMEPHERKEVLAAYFMDREISKGARAEIVRHPKKPPRLAKWEPYPPGYEMSGLMVDPIREAMR